MSDPSRKPRMVGLNHLALEVGDIEEALSFYGEIFDFKLRGRASGMAFIDMGDQFIALSAGRKQRPDHERHFGVVVDDKELVHARLKKAGAEVLSGSGLDFRDPWGNHVQIVEYSEIQFTKAAPVLRGMGLTDLTKSEDAQRQLKEKGMA